MCGIAGIICADGIAYQTMVGSMGRILAHRGPDGHGICQFSHCTLAHARLSIIDLKAGQQPMFTSDRRMAIVFNGEIYGYQSIRNSLSEYPFQTSSDTEVILALYERHGRWCLDHLPGMFAFAIWDDKKRTLFAARDRFGEKPFYYAFGRNGEFVFGSEIKAILASGLVDPIIDMGSVSHYMKYLYVHPERTIYKNVFTLPPAHRLLYAGGHLTVERYWEFPKPIDHICLADAVEHFQQLLSASVKKQLVADVPIGAFLSGGLDSSTVVAIASQYTRQLRTFSFGFEDEASELPFASEIASRYGTDHRELTAQNVDIAELLLLMSHIYDEPFADSSNIPTFLISKLAREELKVVLTGDGADELLGGYGWWYAPLFYMTEAWGGRAVKGWIAKVIVRLLERAHSRKAQAWRWRVDGMGLAKRFTSVTDAYETRSTYFSDAELKDLYLNKYPTGTDRTTYSWVPTNTVNDSLMMDLENYMAGDILVKTDRASMANGLELRAPFLDRDFASFCISLPSTLKINNGRDKYLLREAYGSAWTKTIRKRNKQGFGAPIDRWLARPSVKQLTHEYLGDETRKVFSLIRFSEVQKIRHQCNYKTWVLLVLALWAERHSYAA